MTQLLYSIGGLLLQVHSTVRLLPPSPNVDPAIHFLASLNDLFEHALQNVSEIDLVVIIIHNQVNQNDKAIGFSFRRKD